MRERLAIISLAPRNIADGEEGKVDEDIEGGSVDTGPELAAKQAFIELRIDLRGVR